MHEITADGVDAAAPPLSVLSGTEALQARQLRSGEWEHFESKSRKAAP